MSRDVIIACDFDNEQELRSFLSNFKNEKPFLKIGYQLFYTTGSELISQLIEEGYDIFLDLKLCDIPNTVEHGIKNLAKLGVKFITIHAVGGIAMMSAAVKGVMGTNTKLLAVTQLTSISQRALESELLIDRKLSDVVEHYATSALHSGVHGVICSVWESKRIKERISSNLLTVAPGIRNQKANDDQQRVATAHEAHLNKVDYIVVGRPITQAKDPQQVYNEYAKSFKGK